MGLTWTCQFGFVFSVQLNRISSAHLMNSLRATHFQCCFDHKPALEAESPKSQSLVLWFPSGHLYFALSCFYFLYIEPPRLRFSFGCHRQWVYWTCPGCQNYLPSCCCNSRLSVSSGKGWSICCSGPGCYWNYSRHYYFWMNLGTSATFVYFAWSSYFNSQHCLGFTCSSYCSNCTYQRIDPGSHCSTISDFSLISIIVGWAIVTTSLAALIDWFDADTISDCHSYFHQTSSVCLKVDNL